MTAMWLRDLTDLDWWIALVTAGLLFVVPLAFYPGFGDQFSFPKVLLTELLLSLGLAIWALGFFWGKVHPPKGLLLAAPLALLTMAALTSCFNSPVRAFSLQQAAYFTCGPLWALLLISWERGVERARSASVLAVVAATFVAVITLFQWSGFDPLLSSAERIEWGTMVPRMHLYSTFGNPDLAAGYLIGAFFPALAIGMCSMKTWMRALGYGGAATMLAAIIGEGSHAAWVGLVAGFVIAGLLWKRPADASSLAANLRSTNARTLVTYGLVLSAAVGIAVAFLVWDANALRPRLEGRSFLWRVAWPMVWNHPLLGSGWGSFQLHFLDLQANFLAVHPGLVRYWSNMRHLDNDPLQLLLETGFVGLAASIWVLWAFGRELQNASRVGAARIWIAASAGGVAAILVDSVFNAQLEVPPTLLLLFTLLAFPTLIERETAARMEERPSGSAAANLLEARSESAREQPKFRTSRMIVSSGILVVAGALAVQISRGAVAERDCALAAHFESQGDLYLAEQAYRNGLTFDPLNGKLHFGLGRVLYFRHASAEARDQVHLAERTYRDPHLVVLEGRIEEQMGLVPVALETYRRALRLDPTLTGVQTDIGRLEESSRSALMGSR
jgi:O-antigen ligase